MRQMKKLCYVLTILIVLVALGACGSNRNVDSKSSSIENIASDAVKNQACAYYSLNYDIKLVLADITNVKKISDDEYEVYGKANITDNYGDKWSANFDGKCKVESGNGSTYDMNYDEPSR